MSKRDIGKYLLKIENENRECVKETLGTIRPKNGSSIVFNTARNIRHTKMHISIFRKKVTLHTIGQINMHVHWILQSILLFIDL